MEVLGRKQGRISIISTSRLKLSQFTNIGGTWGTEYGYTFGEYITIGGGITASINTITTPGLQAGTGRILHGHTLENSITRHCEQSELIRLLIDFGV